MAKKEESKRNDAPDAGTVPVVIFEATIAPVQVRKDAVRCVFGKKAGIAPFEDHLTFPRELLGADYDNEEVKFKLMIVRL